LVFRAPQSERVILAGVSLQLEPGEARAVIGLSEAGKSTLVRPQRRLEAPRRAP